jgi:hypothetical protein
MAFLPANGENFGKCAAILAIFLPWMADQSRKIVFPWDYIAT